MVRFLRIDSMLSGSSPISAKLSLRVRRAASSLKMQTWKSRGVVTSRGKTWTMLDEEEAS